MTDKFKELLAEGHRERQENRLSASRAIFIDVVRKAAEEGDRSSLAEALGGLAEAEDGIGNYQAARHHYANAAVLYRQIGPSKMLACTLRHEADLWMQTNRSAEAEPLYLEAEKLYRENGEAERSRSCSYAPSPGSDQRGKGRDDGSQIPLARGLRDLCTPGGKRGTCGVRQETLSPLASPLHGHELPRLNPYYFFIHFRVK